jgi:hypothetical protein
MKSSKSHGLRVRAHLLETETDISLSLLTLLEGARGLAHRAPHGDWHTVHRTGIGTPCTARRQKQTLVSRC